MCFVLIVSCNKAGEINDEQEQTNSADTRSVSVQASDPYRLEVMQQAYDEIARSTGVESKSLQPTDKYVKLLPDEVDCERLSEMGIIIYPARLDGQSAAGIIDGYITQPVVSQDGKAWKYCVVPIDYKFSTGTEYELIYNVFIQRKGGTSRSATQQQIDDAVYKNVLMSSLSMTGNLPSAAWGIEWKPSAKLTFDLDYSKNDIRQVPAVGLKISVRSYTHYGINDVNQDIIGTAYTDINGETGTICTVSGPVYFDILYDDDKWYLKNGNDSSDALVAQSTIPHYTPYNRNFTDGTPLNAFAAVTRALHAYYYEQFPLAEGLGKHSGGFNVGCCDDTHGNFLGRHYVGRYIPDLDNKQCPMLVYLKKDNTRQKPAKDIMGITFHELGHASHDAIQDKYESRGGKKDGESWAQGVKYIYMRSFFGDDYKSDDGDELYTNLVECLFDNGFNISQIQDGFMKTRLWESWKGQMASKAVLAGTKDKFVNYIFDHPNTTKYDLRKIITTSAPKIYKNELGMINFIEDPNNEGVPIDVFSIDDIQFIDNDVTEMESDDMGKYRPFMFSKPGIKTIRTHVAELDEWYETQINVNSLDIFDPPTVNGVAGYTYHYPIRLSLHRYITASNWWTPEPDGRLIEEPLNQERERSAAFYFKTAGEKKIKFDLYYGNLPSPMTVEYERTVTIDIADDKNHTFVLINPPVTFLPNTWYSAKVREGIFLLGAVKSVQLTYNWNYSLPPYYEGKDKDWYYESIERILHFKTPGGGIDCTLRVSFDGINTAAQILVSNVR